MWYEKYSLIYFYVLCDDIYIYHFYVLAMIIFTIDDARRIVVDK